MQAAALHSEEDANYLKKVREQYENYPYPSVNPEDERKFMRLPVSEGLGCLNHYCFSGRKNFKKEFRSLVAGGGTGDAAIALAEQLRDTGNEVVYIDMSETSMKIAQRRAEIRGLTNIRWIRDSLLNIPNLGLGQFDYINSSGVLHHLEDPDLGLKTLSDALKDDGAMGIMLYAKYGRMAVYIMQETLRMINRDEPNLQKQVENAKTILGDLPMTNWLFGSSQMILDEMRKGGDIGIYDLLLHTQDRAYSIPELYAFMQKAGLNILQLFSDHKNIAHQIYNPAHYLHDDRLVALMAARPLEQQRALAELLHGKIEKHCFYAAKRLPSVPSVDDVEMVPVLDFSIVNDHEAIAKNIAQREPVLKLHQHTTDTRLIAPNGQHLDAIWAQIDGKKSLRDIYRSIMNKSKDNSVNFQTLSMQFKPFYEALHRVGWMFLRHQSTMPVIYQNEMQARIPRESA